MLWPRLKHHVNGQQNGLYSKWLHAGPGIGTTKDEGDAFSGKSGSKSGEMVSGMRTLRTMVQHPPYSWRI
jgi:hypothetical protein